MARRGGDCGTIASNAPAVGGRTRLDSALCGSKSFGSGLISRGLDVPALRIGSISRFSWQAALVCHSMRSHGGLREGRLCRATRRRPGACDLGNGTTDATAESGRSGATGSPTWSWRTPIRLCRCGPWLAWTVCCITSTICGWRSRTAAPSVPRATRRCRMPCNGCASNTRFNLRRARGVGRRSTRMAQLGRRESPCPARVGLLHRKIVLSHGRAGSQ